MNQVALILEGFEGMEKGWVGVGGGWGDCQGEKRREVCVVGGGVFLVRNTHGNKQIVRALLQDDKQWLMSTSSTSLSVLRITTRASPVTSSLFFPSPSLMAVTAA